MRKRGSANVNFYNSNANNGKKEKKNSNALEVAEQCQ